MAKAKFKVGDKVRIVAEKEGSFIRDYDSNHKRGTVYTIDDIKTYSVLNPDYKLLESGKWADEVFFEMVSEHDFKAGDKVRLLKRSGAVPAGTIATVLENDHMPAIPLLITFDDYSFPDRWVNLKDVELVETPVAPVSKAEPETGTYIVIVEQDGKLAPATTPRVYGSKALAEHVAKDMAKRHGGKFLVFRATFEAQNLVSERSL